jgi:hypothetical protein
VSHPKCGVSIEVFYLARGSNPVDLTRRFAESYLAYPAGICHRLTLICKGFQNQQQIAEHRSLFGGASLSVFEVPDSGYDIGAYRIAMETSRSDLCCFLNSHSVICAPGWLATLAECALDSKVGIVGATASYESAFTNARATITVSKSGYRAWLRRFFRLVRNWAYFPAFPNPHIRTNAFMIRRDVFQRIRWPRSISKLGALRFESGRLSLTRQVLKMGLNVVIVGRDGQHYGASDWPSSGTFRQNEQQNLLVADNRTTEYATAAPEFRSELTIKAWGTKAAE